LGCGYWGANLARTLNRLGCLAALCDLPGRVDNLARQYPGARVSSDSAALFADPAIDAVAISTPAETHHALTLRALEAGKDVFVEKPLALEWQDGIEMVEAARTRGRILMVGHLLLYHPAVIRLRQLLQEGGLGKIEYIYSNRLSMGKIRREENALWSFAPHDISVILALMGRMPVQVSAVGGAYLQPNIADVTVSHLLFGNGERAHIFVSWLHPYKEQRLVVIGSKQMAVFEDSRKHDKLMLFDKQIELKGGQFEANKSEGVPVPIDDAEPLREECAHFIDCVTTRSAPRTPGEDGVAVLQVLGACQRSLQMNGDPVAINVQSSQKVRML
jgi:UDP-2-acetamido-3-amino-2,3-dideoxy-glucuronate N-acetyltransferase